MIENKDRLLPLDDDASTITDDVEKADRSIDPRTESCIFIVCIYDDDGRAATVGGRRRRRRNGRRETRGAR